MARPPPIPGEVFLLAQRLLRGFENRLLQALAERGFHKVRPAYMAVFRNMHPEGSRLTDVARRAGLTKQAVGLLVRDMEALEMVEVVDDPSDGRAKLVRMTAAARRRLPEVKAVVDAIEGEYRRRLGPARMTKLEALLRLAADVVAGAPPG
jgi:DNA-binding MarR family transcriptional regulator